MSRIYFYVGMGAGLTLVWALNLAAYHIGQFFQ